LIFDFDHTRSMVAEAVAQERSTRATLSKVESDLVLQVKQAFYSYAQDVRLVDVNKNNYENQESHLALAQARLKAGVGLPSDVVRAETAVADAVFSLNLADNNASVARVNLAELMGIDPRTPVAVGDAGEPPLHSTDVNSLVETGLAQRPDILQALEAVNAAKHGVQVAKTYNSPSVTASAGWLQDGAGFPLKNDYLSAGIGITWDLFDSGYSSGGVKVAKGNLQVAEAQLNSTRLAVISDVSQAYLNLKTAQQRLVTAQAEVANGEEGVRLAEGRYRSGLGTFLDVIDAQTALVTANTNKVNAQSSVDQARASLAHAIGK
jgi:outer membrane protein